jgi:hypothetical protein
VAKTVALGAQPAPRQPPPVATPDDAWEEESDEDKTNVVEHEPAPPPPAVVATTPRAPAAAASLTAEDLRTIVKEMIDQAVQPLHHRIAELERRPRAPSAPAIVVQQQVAVPASPVHAAPVVAMSPAPPIAHAAPPAPAAAIPPAPITYASAIAAPSTAPVVAGHGSAVPAPPQVDLAALARELPNDIDIPFDGRRRRRRMVTFFVFALLIFFGGLGFLLIDSYSHHNP